ncbi:MAG: hypothetical protein WCH44_14715 [Betaproteobacteria bacterium]
MFAGFTITREDARDAYGELRLQTLGMWQGVVVFAATPHRSRRSGRRDLDPKGAKT